MKVKTSIQSFIFVDPYRVFLSILFFQFLIFCISNVSEFYKFQFKYLQELKLKTIDIFISLLDHFQTTSQIIFSHDYTYKSTQSKKFLQLYYQFWQIESLSSMKRFHINVFFDFFGSFYEISGEQNLLNYYEKMKENAYLQKKTSCLFIIKSLLNSKGEQGMKEQNIFIENENDSDDNYQIQYIDDWEDPKFIAQFLQMKKQEKNCFNTKDAQIEEKNYVSFYQSQNQENQAEVTPKSVSNFHNFQKHLVYTLRNSLYLPEMSTSPQSFKIQSKLWKQFLIGKKPSKMLTYITLGAIPYDGKVNQKLIRKHGFQKLYQQYDYNVIKVAQENLRMAITRELKQIDLDIEVNKRKIKKKEQFKAYFQQFIIEISHGNFNRRCILKKKKKYEEKQKDKEKKIEDQYNQQEIDIL